MINTNKKYGDKVAVVLFEIMKRNDKTLTNTEIYSHVANALGLTEEDKAKKYKSGAYIYQNHIQFGLLGLKVMGIVEHVARGKWSITKKGEEINRLEVEEYSHFQRNYWNQEVSKKRKIKSGKQLPLQQNKLFDEDISGVKKEQILSVILEQNKRILDYIMGKK